jgi:hypothetical protein
MIKVVTRDFMERSMTYGFVRCLICKEIVKSIASTHHLRVDHHLTPNKGKIVQQIAHSTAIKFYQYQRVIR